MDIDDHIAQLNRLDIHAEQVLSEVAQQIEELVRKNLSSQYINEDGALKEHQEMFESSDQDMTNDD